MEEDTRGILTDHYSGKEELSEINTVIDHFTNSHTTYNVNHGVDEIRSDLLLRDKLSSNMLVSHRHCEKKMSRRHQEGKKE